MLNIGRVSVPPTNVARKVPRLADFRIDDKTSLMSMVVIRGAVRACDIAIICLLGFAVAVSYVDEPAVLGSTYYMAAIAMTAVVTAAGFDMLGLYSRTAFNSFISHMPRVVAAWTAAFALLLAGCTDETTPPWQLAATSTASSLSVLSIRALYALRIPSRVADASSIRVISNPRADMVSVHVSRSVPTPRSS